MDRSSATNCRITIHANIHRIKRRNHPSKVNATKYDKNLPSAFRQTKEQLNANAKNRKKSISFRKLKQSMASFIKKKMQKQIEPYVNIWQNWTILAAVSSGCVRVCLFPMFGNIGGPRRRRRELTKYPILEASANSAQLQVFVHRTFKDHFWAYEAQF